MRTEVKIAFLIVPVVVLVCIIFFVNQNRTAATPVKDIVDFAHPAPSGTPAGAPSTANRTRNTPPRSTAPNQRSTPPRPRPEVANRGSTPPPPGRTSPGATGGSETARRPVHPLPAADKINEEIRRLAGLTGPTGHEPVATPPSTPGSTPPPASQPSRSESPVTPAPRPAVSEPVTTRPATPPVDRQTPAVAPPKPESPTPTGAPSSSGLPGYRPSAPGERKHTIVASDTLWDIAEKYYGNGAAYHRILDANPGLDANRLLVGQEIKIPAAEAAPASPTAAKPAGKPAEAKPGAAKPAEKPAARKHTYVVEHGDTLIDIARNVLKDGNRWREIYELNKSKIADPNVLKVGQELLLPEK